MRSMWKGAISFGLVHIPIKLYSATEKKDIKFNLLHEKCKSPIQYRKFCPVCNSEVPLNEIVKGYEYEEGKYVIMKEDELEGTGEKSKAIGIVNFVDLSDIDPVYFDKSYYLAPTEGGQKAFELLRRSLEKTDKVAIAKITIRTKDSLAAIRAYKNNILLETMFYPDEIRSTNELSELKYNVTLHDNELKMAESLINSLSEEFVPANMKNEYRIAIEERIEKKIAGAEISVPPGVENKVVDLMEALKASIKAAKEKTDTAKAEDKDKKPKTRKQRVKV